MKEAEARGRPNTERLQMPDTVVPAIFEGSEPDEKSFRRKTKTVPEVAAELGIGRNAAYEAVKRGEIPTVKIGRRLLVPRDAVDRILQRAMEPQPQS
jgi:excisionase family DNA binding protein